MQRAGRHVLIVEDDRDCAEALKQYISLWESDVVTATSGAEALEVSRARVPDVVVLDLGLPEIDGFEVARRLRALPGGMHARIVAVTGYVSTAHRARAAEAGCNAFLVKPYALDELVAAMGIGAVTTGDGPASQR